MTRLEKFNKLLGDIYGKRIVKEFTTKDKDSDTLRMNSVANNQKAKKEYGRNEGEGCKECKGEFRNKNITFFKRNLEFPGWIDKLDFSGTTPAKEIMIIGIEPPQLKEQINISFGLGLHPIESNGELNFDQLKKTYSGENSRFEKIRSNQESDNAMWKYLNRLFSGKLDGIKDQIYITDLCKCNDKTKDNVMWKNCFSAFLIKEIELINPNLIIFQGWAPYKFVLEHFLKKDQVPKNPPYYGEFPLKGKNVSFFKIYHQAYVRDRLDENGKSNYINPKSEFIKNNILKEVPEINKLLNRE